MDCDDHVDFINQLKSKYPPVIVEEAPEPSLNYDEYGPRLIIEKIENENFKSYGGTQTLGPFHKNFTCVIGPNGSGKSNVIDSLLFVFGFRASKIRSKKLSVLIHKSELYPNLDSCSVRVFFQKIKPLGDGDDEYEVIPNSEFVVVRTAYKDNTSIYKINNKKVNNKEVSEFLKKQGIDLDHNRFLILQGEVEQIALMKPKATTEYEDGFLEYLEDIIGSHRFKEPLQILFSRLDELCDLRTEKLNRVKIVGKEKKELEGVRNEAVKYLRLCNEIVIRKNISFQLKMRDLNLLEASAVEKQNEVKLELEQITSDIERINNLRVQKENELKEIVQKHLLKMQQFDVSQKKFRDLEIEDVNLRDKRKHFKMKLDELTKMIKLKEKEILKYERVPSESVSRIEELQSEAEKLEETKAVELKDQERVQISLKKETEELVNAKDLKSADLRKQQELAKKQEAEILERKCELDLLVGNYEKEKLAYAQLESRSKSIKEKIIESREQLQKLEVDVPKMKKDYAETMIKFKNLKDEEKSLVTEVDQLFYKLNATRSKEDENKILSFLFAQQNLGKVSGVIGRLGNLAAVDTKYDIAISTACGRLDNIVADKIDNAMICAQLMKENNISRSTFIGLDKIQSWENKANKPFNAIPNAPRAFDLLIFSNQNFRAVFYFALRDLLISNDTRDSVQINRGKTKFRIVTMKGQITEIHGAMTGGGSRSIQGKICTDPTKIHKYEHHSGIEHNVDNRDLEAKAREKEQRLHEVRQEINSLTPRLEALKNEMMKASDSKTNLKSSLDFLCREEKEKEKEIKLADERLSSKKPDLTKVKSLEGAIDKLEQKYQRDCAIAKTVSGELDKINEEIMSIGVARLESIKSRIASTADKIKENSRMLKKINLSVKNAETILKRTVVEMDSLKEDKTKYQMQLEEMDVTLKNLEKKAEDTLQEYNSSNQEVNELMKLKDEQVQAQNKVTEELQNSKQVQIQVKRDYEDKKLKVDQIRGRVRQMQDEIQKLTLYPLPEGVQEDEDDHSFMDLIGETGDAVGVFSSQKDSQCGAKLRVYTDEELLALKVHQITYQDMEDKLQKQTPNLAAIEEYRMKEELYLQRAAELNEVTQLRDCQRDELDRLKRQRHQEFTAGFNLITSKLKEMYQMITMGGDADLELADSLDPFSEGILFSVRPPKKSWKYINNLSGGEKTLSSLALVFALHHFKPTPFYVMDEIDAALDFKNVSIVANYLKARTKNAQFIIISLRNNMYELSDRLVGIYKPFNVSKVCVLNPNKLASCLKSTQIQTTNSQIQVATNQKPSENDTGELSQQVDSY